MATVAPSLLSAGESTIASFYETKQASVDRCSALSFRCQSLCINRQNGYCVRLMPAFSSLDKRTVELNRVKRSCISANAITYKGEVSSTFEFLDEGDSVEVRVPLGCRSDELQSNQLAINTHDDSLLVTLATEDLLRPLLVAVPLYAEVSPSDTIWFLDEDELVINLRKVNKDLDWPDLIEAASSLAKGLGSMLKSCSINVVGDSSEANWSLAKELASLLGYVPMSTQQLIESAIGRSVDSLREEEGDAGVAEAEGAMLEGLTSNVRCVVGTLGYGASGFPSANVRWLHAGVTLSLQSQTQSTSAESGTSPSNQDSSFSWADLQIKTELPADKWEVEDTQNVAKSALQAMKKLLESYTKLTGKKGLYLRLGCRGDWPEIMPPGWGPNSSQN